MSQQDRRKQFEEQVTRQRVEREKWLADWQKDFEQRMKDRANGKDDRRNEAIKQTLEMTDAQWRVVEPKINRIYFLKDQSSISIALGGAGGYAGGGASGSGGSSSDRGAGAARSSGVNAISTGTASFGAGTSGGYGTQSSGGGGYSSGAAGSSAGGGGGVAQTWSGPIWRLAERELTEGEKTCDRLSELLDDKNSKQEQIDQGVSALRQARESAARELSEARKQLREVLTPRQQARLVLTGLLD